MHAPTVDCCGILGPSLEPSRFFATWYCTLCVDEVVSVSVVPNHMSFSTSSGSPAQLTRQMTNTFKKGASAMCASFNVRQNVERQGSANNLLSLQSGEAFSTTSVEQQRAEFKRQVLGVRRQLRQSAHCTLNPHSKYVRFWDAAIVCAMAHTVLVTPWEVAFSADATLTSFVVNRVVDTAFAMDVLLSFFMPYREVAGGFWVSDRRRITNHYCRTWFVPDVITCIPFEVLVGTAHGDGVPLASGSGSASSNQTLRLLRMVRLLKLARVLRASRILTRWQDHVCPSKWDSNALGHLDERRCGEASPRCLNVVCVWAPQPSRSRRRRCFASLCSPCCLPTGSLVSGPYSEWA